MTAEAYTVEPVDPLECARQSLTGAQATLETVYLNYAPNSEEARAARLQLMECELKVVQEEWALAYDDDPYSEETQAAHQRVFEHEAKINESKYPVLRLSLATKSAVQATFNKR